MDRKLNPKRLVRVETLTHQQERTLMFINGTDGVCTCGLQLTATSPKFVLCNAVVNHPLDPKLNGSLIMAAYCLGCFTAINNVLKMLAGSNAVKGDVFSPSKNN